MNDILFDNTKIASYFFWEYTQADNALALWVCAEDTANYMEVAGIFEPAQIDGIIKKGVYSVEYIAFVRHIAYRLYVYTGNDEADTNWFNAEKLIRNDEWCAAVTKIATVYYENKSNFESLQGVRSERVRNNHM